MKKIILFVAVLALSSFKISIEPREAMAQERVMSDMSLKVESQTYQADGMTYRVFVGRVNADGVDIEVVNVTKEKLEIEKLKKEIEKLNFESRNRK